MLNRNIFITFNIIIKKKVLVKGWAWVAVTKDLGITVRVYDA